MTDILSCPLHALQKCRTCPSNYTNKKMRCQGEEFHLTTESLTCCGWSSPARSIRILLHNSPLLPARVYTIVCTRSAADLAFEVMGTRITVSTAVIVKIISSCFILFAELVQMLCSSCGLISSQVSNGQPRNANYSPSSTANR